MFGAKRNTHRTTRQPSRNTRRDTAAPQQKRSRRRMVSSLRRRIPPAAWLLLLVAALIPFGLLAPTAAYTAEPNRMTITSVEPIPADLAFEHGSRIAVNTVRAVLEEHPEGPEVLFVCFNPAAEEIYRRLLGEKK